MVDLMGVETMIFNLGMIFKKLGGFEFWIKNINFKRLGANIDDIQMSCNLAGVLF